MPTLSFGLADDEFWSDTQRTLESTVEEARETDFRGILLEGPKKVDLGLRQTMPLVGLRRTTFEDAFHLRLETRAVIAALSHRDNAVRAATAWENKSEEEEDFTPPESGFPEGTSINPFEVSARERLPGLPWEAGVHTFILYLFDQQSNPVTLEFEADKASDGPANRPAAQHPRSVRPSPDPEAGHSFEKSPESPELPEGEGIALKADRVEFEAGSRACMLRGAFRLKALPGERLDSRGGAAAPAGAGNAEAIVPITLLVLGKEIAGPYLFTVQAPASPSPRQGLVEGYFHVNLFRMAEPFGIPQDYVARALHPAAQSQPVGFEIEKAPARH